MSPIAQRRLSNKKNLSLLTFFAMEGVELFIFFFVASRRVVSLTRRSFFVASRKWENNSCVRRKHTFDRHAEKKRLCFAFALLVDQPKNRHFRPFPVSINILVVVPDKKTRIRKKERETMIFSSRPIFNCGEKSTAHRVI